MLRASYARVQATVGVGTVLIWDFGVAYTRGGGYLFLWLLICCWASCGRCLSCACASVRALYCASSLGQAVSPAVSVSAIAVSPDGTRVAVGYQTSKLVVWQLQSFEDPDAECPLNGHTDAIQALEWQPSSSAAGLSEHSTTLSRQPSTILKPPPHPWALNNPQQFSIPTAIPSPPTALNSPSAAVGKQWAGYPPGSPSPVSVPLRRREYGLLLNGKMGLEGAGPPPEPVPNERNKRAVRAVQCAVCARCTRFGALFYKHTIFSYSHTVVNTSLPQA